ncbi:MAG: M20/M25/M40 family metallo-hydrolase [Bryobacteraceae bacterium]
MFLLVLLAPLLAFAQAQSPAVGRALSHIQARHEATLDFQVRVAEIPAPTFHESERAKFMADAFRRIGLKDVEIDAKGNVLGWRPGRRRDALLLAAHLDISFAPGVDTRVRKEGGRWHGPGLADDSRGLAALVAIAEALDHAGIETEHTIAFVANVGEEGLGDLGGVRYLFGEGPHKSRFKAFISIDGTNPGRIVNGGTGVKRYRVTARGPGGHSYGNFGRPSPIHALGRVVAALSAFEVPREPRTTYNVGRMGGGTAVNAIAEEAWIEVDLRSEGPSELDRLEVRFLESVRVAVEAENAQRKGSGKSIDAETKLVSNRPAGTTPESAALVKAALAASKATGHAPSLVFSSTDSNIPISLGIPAVTLGGGGRSDNAHSLEEWFEPAGAWKGPQTVLLTILHWDAAN